MDQCLVTPAYYPVVLAMSGVRRIHHLNCGSFNSLASGPLVSHVLLCETNDGLVLVDSGIGRSDIAAPKSRLGRVALALGPALRVEETAAHQIEALGYQLSDVRHIVATHLDYDHIGGALDFPHATVHTTAAELRTAQARRRLPERLRYRRPHVEAITSFQTYDGTGEELLGLPTAHPILGVEDVWLVPMPGHSIGHAGVAVRTSNRGWLFHAGDSFYHRAALSPSRSAPISHAAILGAIELTMASIPAKVRANHQQLRKLAHDPSQRVSVFCAHDAVLFDRLRAEQSPIFP